MKHLSLRHRFVKHFPESLESGDLYISIDYSSVTHICCCGCGEEVVTPLSPAEWQITYDGRSISLSPSIGSWQLACKSHYFIRQGKVQVAGQWTDEQIASGQRRDQLAKEKQYGNCQQQSRLPNSGHDAESKRRHWFCLLVDWFLGR